MRERAPVPTREQLPSGTLSFLFTDIEGSTRLLRKLRSLYARALAEHAAILREAAERFGGRLMDAQGDATFFVFPRARDALAAAVTAQRRLAEHRFPEGVRLRVRMGVHTGEPEVDGERYVGLDVHRSARICDAGHGGQILLSQLTAALVQDDLMEGVALRPIGSVKLKDFPRPELLYDVTISGLPSAFPPPRVAGADAIAAPEAPSASELELRLLGPVELCWHGRPLPISAPRHRQILTVLGLAAGEVVSSERLVEALWGERPPPTAGRMLQTYVGELRRLLGQERAAALASQAPGYRLSLPRESVDLHRFERLWQEGREALAEGEATRAAEALEHALALWRGAALADVAHERAFEAETARLDELRLACLEDRFEAELQLGHHDALVADLQKHVHDHPLRERACGQLMLALYRCGRQADALDAYAQARQKLLDRLGIDASPALAELERRIRQQDGALAAPSARSGPPPRVVGAPVRTLLVVSQRSDDIEDLLQVALPLARAHGGHDVVLTRVVTPLPGDDARRRLREVTRRLAELRERLAESGDEIRVAAFASASPDQEMLKLTVQQDADLVLLEGSRTLLEGRSGIVDELLARSPSDVALLIPRRARLQGGDIVCPFAGGEHDWAALELAAALARAVDARLILAGAAGPGPDAPDASRLLANASLVIQRTGGIVAEPLLVPLGAHGMLTATRGAAFVVSGLSPRYRSEGIGETRLRIAHNAAAPVVFVRRGNRPGILAPPHSLTRFTWSLRA